MKEERGGWVIICTCHPITKGRYIVTDTFSATKNLAISKFAQDSGKSWRYWEDNYNFMAIRAIRTISVEL